MPLVQSSSKQALGENIGIEEASGKSTKQAAAIAYATQRANDSIPEYCMNSLSSIPDTVSVRDIADKSKTYGG